jgi:hypothetical protein
MEELDKNKLSGIIKFIYTMYNPVSIDIIDADSSLSGELTIRVTFDYNNLGDYEFDLDSDNDEELNKMLKGVQLKKFIRKDIYDYFGVLTSGMPIDGGNISFRHQNNGIYVNVVFTS